MAIAIVAYSTGKIFERSCVMQALVFEQTGEPLEVLVLADVPMPQVDRGDVLVQVSVRPIQPADSLFIAGRYRTQPRFPQVAGFDGAPIRSEEHTSELQSLMRISYAVFCLKQKNKTCIHILSYIYTPDS